MAVTVPEKLHNAERHLKRASDADKTFGPTSPQFRDLLIAVAYLYSAVEQIAAALQRDYEGMR